MHMPRSLLFKVHIQAIAGHLKRRRLAFESINLGRDLNGLSFRQKAAVEILKF
jgi:hypothetical protein